MRLITERNHENLITFKSNIYTVELWYGSGQLSIGLISMEDRIDGGLESDVHEGLGNKRFLSFVKNEIGYSEFKPDQAELMSL